MGKKTSGRSRSRCRFGGWIIRDWYRFFLDFVMVFVYSVFAYLREGFICFGEIAVVKEVDEDEIAGRPC